MQRIKIKWNKVMSNLADEISKELERQGISRENLKRADIEKIYLNLGK